MLIKKYTALIYKDLLICKNLYIFLILSVLFPFITPKELLISSFYVPAIMLMYLNSLLPSVGPLWQQEKNNGYELLITTACTRRDVVICRYLTLMLVNLINLFFYFAVIWLLTNQLVFVRSSGIILFVVLFFMVSLIVPISFKFKAMATSVIESVLFFPFIIVFQFVNLDNILKTSYCIGIIIFSIILLFISVRVSLLFYRKKDF